MHKKSKLLTFVFSIVPGMGQIYIGDVNRGLGFLAAVIMNLIVIIFCEAVLGMNIGKALVFLFPIIWIVGMVDSMILVDKMNKDRNIEKKEDTKFILEGEANMQNKKIIAMALSVIPGAGHMYLDLKKQGVQLMGMFFLSFFLVDFLSTSFFMIFIPIIWFYSLFDVMHKVSQEEIKDSDIPIWHFLNEKTKNKDRNKIIGYGLIFIGLIAILQKILLPIVEEYICWGIMKYMQTGIAALLFILGGIKLVIGSKKEKIQDKEKI